MTTKQIPVWIDCDTGTDDSVAIMLAHALPELSVVALSAVAGNSPLYNTFPNTRRIVHLLGADYPVYPGAEQPPCAGTARGRQVPWRKRPRRCRAAPAGLVRLKPRPRGTHSIKRRSGCRANCVWSRPGR